MRWGHRAFARVSKGDSHLSSSCEMKGEPSFKPLQGNPAFFRVRTSRCPFHLRQQTQAPSHIPIAEGCLHLRCLRKMGLPLKVKPGNQLSSRDDMGYTELSSSCCAEIGVPLNLCCNWCSSRLETGVSGNWWSCLKEVKPLSFTTWNTG